MTKKEKTIIQRYASNEFVSSVTEKEFKKLTFSQKLSLFATINLDSFMLTLHTTAIGIFILSAMLKPVIIIPIVLILFVEFAFSLTMSMLTVFYPYSKRFDFYSAVEDMRDNDETKENVDK